MKYWVTVNEPSVLCQYGYGSDLMIPGLNLSGKADYICGHNLLLAHAEIYDVYQKKYQAKQNGKTVKKQKKKNKKKRKKINLLSNQLE